MGPWALKRAADGASPVAEDGGGGGFACECVVPDVIGNADMYLLLVGCCLRGAVTGW